MDILEKGMGRMRSCTRQPPEPQYARALVLVDVHMVPPSPLAAILKNGYQPLYFARVYLETECKWARKCAYRSVAVRLVGPD